MKVREFSYKFIYLSIHQSFKHLLSAFYVSSKVLGTGNIKMNETQLLKNSPSRGEDRCLNTESFVFSVVLEIGQVYYRSNSSWGVGEWGPELRQEGFLEVMMMS